MYPAHDKGVGGYYYPIYKGWATTVTPIFETASTAICFQISQYKRDLREHNTIKTPVWLDVIGSIDPSDFANIISHKFQSTSLINNCSFLLQGRPGRGGNRHQREISVYEESSIIYLGAMVAEDEIIVDGGVVLFIGVGA